MDFNNFKERFEKIKVIKCEAETHVNPLVSVCVTTFQHAKYIRQCLDGILMQQTNFEFEILIGEDMSNDGTREICLEYIDRFPNKIRLFLHRRENNISIDGAPTGRFNFIYNLFSSRGKYIALCDGDDYWTDPLKLQKQVDFLETRNDCSMCFTDAKLLLPNGEIVDGTNLPPADETTMEDLANNDNYIYAATVLFRMECFILPSLLLKTPVGDYPLYLLLSEKGKMKFLQDFTTVYRVGVGLWGKKDSVGTSLIWVKTLTLLIEHFKDNQAMLSILKKRYKKKCTDLLQAGLRQERPWLEMEKYYFLLIRYRERKYIAYLKQVATRIFPHSLLNFLRGIRHKCALLTHKIKN